MDKHLRRLKRAANYDPEAKDRYIEALERVVGGGKLEEHPYFNDARIASVWIKDNPDLENELFNNLDNIGAYRISDVNGSRTGFMVDVFWEDQYDEEDFEQLDIELSDELEQLFADAANRGYSMMVFWV